MTENTPNTLFIGQHQVHLDQVDSTNNHTIELMRQCVITEGAVVIAQKQLKGKGQRGNSWESDAGKNLTFSFLLEPKFIETTYQFVLNQIVSLAITDLLLSKGLKEVSVKWPNDVMVKKNKIAGILIENNVRNRSIVSSVVGVGLNVNQTEFSAKLTNAISMANELGHMNSLPEVLTELLEHLEARYLQARSSFEKLKEVYLQRLFQFDEWENYKAAGTSFEGRIAGIDAFGKLLVENRTGNTKSYAFKEIEFLI